jgi:mannose-1-phosphate guanylyltransferase
MTDDRAARITKNEVIAREINEGIEEAIASRTPEGHARMLCECGNRDCELLIAISVSEYEDVHQDPRRFVVVKDHVIPEVERVVAETERFTVVQKREGTPEEVAEESDPRD